MKTETVLSTQILIGLFLAHENPPEMTKSGPTSSSADMHLPRYLPFILVLLRFIADDQGTYDHQQLVTTPTPSPLVAIEPPAASV